MIPSLHKNKIWGKKRFLEGRRKEEKEDEEKRIIFGGVKV